MKRLILFVSVLIVICFANYAQSTPVPPQLCFSTTGLSLSVSWTVVDDTTSYVLYYAPFPYTGPESIGNLDMGSETEFNINLWEGASYYIAVTARNDTGESEYSNIEQFTMTSSTNSGTLESCQATNQETFTLPDSGQKYCYNSAGNFINCHGTGQDGEFTINAMSFTDNGDATVTDNVTGLIWQQRDDNIPRNWAAAVEYCNNLSLGGVSDWRLPERLELISIVDYGMRSPAINSNYFLDTKSSLYWTADIPELNLNSAWAIYFLHGGGGNFSNTAEYYVRCVR